MEVWLWVLIGILVLIIIFLWIKIYLLRKSASEIETAFADRLMTETNVLIDISSRDRYMRQLAEGINTQLRQLRKERRRFQQGDFELKEAVTNISHDLRTPLTAICGYLDLLEQEEKSEAVKRYLDIICHRTEALKQLTEELFRYSVITSKTNDMVYETVILNNILEEGVSAYYASLKEQNIVPQIKLPKKKVKRNLDKNALMRILGNIISNAIKYSDGDLNISLSESGEFVFSNHTTQLGEVEVGKLFNRFYTVETAKKSTGLGLSIAKTLTEQMGGIITSCYDSGIISIRILFPEPKNEI